MTMSLHFQRSVLNAALKPTTTGQRCRRLQATAALKTATVQDNSFQQQSLPNGFSVRHTSTAAEVLFLFDEVYSEQQYTQHGVQLRPGDTVLDVGANIGMFSMLAAEEVGPSGRVISAEAAPGCAVALALNLEDHAAWCAARGEQVASSTVLPVAVTQQEHPDGVQMTVYRWAAGWSTLAPDADEVVRSMQYYVQSLVQQPGPGEPSTAADDTLHQEDARHLSATNGSAASSKGWSPLQQILVQCVKLLAGVPLLKGMVDNVAAAYVRVVMMRDAEAVMVPAATVSSIIRDHDIRRLDLLKVDVERAELQVLQGIQQQHWHLIQQVAMEVHDIDGRLADVTRLLQQQGFQRVVCQQSPQLQGSALFNIYATRTP